MLRYLQNCASGGKKMLFLAHTMPELSFSALMEVYLEGNRENGMEFYPELPEDQRLLRAEQDFYGYLTDVFFHTAGAVCAVWEEDGRYLSALRLEPYRDGLLLEALETRPDRRRKGYGERLILAVLARFSGVKIYSHVGKRNVPSLRIHEKCGFRRISENAVYIDGSVNSRCCTLCFDSEAAGKCGCSSY